MIIKQREQIFRMIAIALLAILVGVEARAGSIVFVEEYATLAERPMTLSFGANGELFAGSSGVAGADTRPSWVYRIAPGGGVATTYGNSTIPDPDAVVYNPSTGAVIVGGLAPWNGVQVRGRLSTIQPDGSIQSVDTPLFQNPGQMAFDSTGRLLFTDIGETRGVFAVTPSSGGPQLSKLIDITDPLKTPLGLAIGADDRIYTSHADGVIRIHNPDGSLIDDAFATPSGSPGWAGGSVLAFANGGMFGTDLYASSGNSGQLFRIGSDGQSTTLLSLSGPITGIAFGPDGAMYLSDLVNSRILRVTLSDPPPTVIPEPSSILLASFGGMAIFSIHRWRRRPRPV